MIFYQPDEGVTNGLDLGSTVLGSTPEDVDELEKGAQAYQDLRKRYQKMLGYFYGGNTAQRAGGENQEFPNFQTIAGLRKEASAGKITGRDYLQMTGRINAGIGTGDVPIRGDRGDIVGYKSPSGAALQGGSLVGGRAQITPEADWRKMFPRRTQDAPTQDGPHTSFSIPETSGNFGFGITPHQSAYAY